LATVTTAVVGVAISKAEIWAVNCELLTKVVVRGLPFHWTVEPETNPVPFTVIVNEPAPGAVAAGTSGSLMNGTGLDPEVAKLEGDITSQAKQSRPQHTRRIFMLNSFSLFRGGSG
jgi:hypothetical protein